MTNQLAHASLRDDLIANEELRIQSEELLTALVTNLSDENVADPYNTSFVPVFDILDSISYSRARQGFSPREVGEYIFSLKDALLEILHDSIKAPDSLYVQSMKITKLIDGFGVVTFERFIHSREDVVRRQASEIDEISNPIIEVWDGVVAVPVIGTLDRARAQSVMENLLQKIFESDSAVAILDISGVPAVDSLVAQHLLQTVAACRLLGTECIISGVRPEITQTIVHLGIDLSSITTKATLASALKTAFHNMQLRVEKNKTVFSR